MSWLTLIQNDMIIRTGDGEEYRPKWLNASKSVDYNISEFEFPGLQGTLVHREEVKGTRYALEIHFDGEDHLDIATAFEVSARDKRAWTIIHPFYGALIVQPAALNFANEIYNVTKITGTVIETITEDAPKTSVDPVNKISADKDAVDETFSVAFTNDVEPTTEDINNLSGTNEDLYNLGSKRVKLTVDAEEYFNLFNKAEAAIINATAEPLAAIRQMNTALSYPAKFTDSVVNRLTTLIDQFNLLRTSIGTITSPSFKKIYENNAAALVSAMTVASSTPQAGDYQNRDDVYRSVENILAAYNTYITDLDEMQTDNGAEPDSYIPDADSLIALSDLMNYTLSNLFNIAIDAKQERTLILENDSNAILLTHRFYGLDEVDANLDTFLNNNNIGLNELLMIRKGRKLIYYV
jgi:hypothetical protein